MSLTAKTCTPCRGGVPPLPAAEAQRLLAQIPGWRLTDDATWLRRSFEFPDFVSAMAFAGRIGELAEEEGHHPDLEVGWGYCTVKLQTHKIRGLHENDFIMAAKIGELAAAARG